MRILWLYGPPAVGKSVTAWELLNARARIDAATGYIDIDQIGMSYCDEQDRGGFRIRGRALAAVAGEFARCGVRSLVVSGVLGIELMDFYAEELTEFDPVFVRLTLSDGELRRRLASRGPYAEEWAGVRRHARRLESTELGHPVVQTEPGAPHEVAARVLEVVAPLLDDLPASPRASGVVTDPGRSDDREVQALLLGGTTAVGKSTIGWQTFMAAQKQGKRAAFVDLRQLGFIGVDGGAIDHRLQARAASALWRVFRAHGARFLILNGPVNSSAELLEYQRSLADTTLTAVRLTAERCALIERVGARIRGEMVALAGDSLIGRPAAQAQAIVDAALRRQNQPEFDDSFPTLDTTALDPVESAKQILDASPTHRA